jgi:hypothetical protein
MNASEVEAWALTAVETMLAGGQDEESRVEMKSAWPTDYYKNAWQLGGQANAARGQPILWIVGPDARNRTLSTPAREELANWWPQVQKHFDDQLTPTLVMDLVVPIRTERVVVLYFETDRAPYVVKEQDKKQVPWRVATGTLAAGRQQLVRLLAPMVPLPSYEETVGRVGVVDFHFKPCEVFASVTAFVLPQNLDKLYIARHRCSLRVRFPKAGLTYDVPIRSLDEYNDNPGPDDDDDPGWEIMLVDKPLKLEVFGGQRLDAWPTLPQDERPEVDLTIGLTTTDVRSKITAVCATEDADRAPPERMWHTVS